MSSTLSSHETPLASPRRREHYAPLAKEEEDDADKETSMANVVLLESLHLDSLDIAHDEADHDETNSLVSLENAEGGVFRKSPWTASTTENSELADSGGTDSKKNPALHLMLTRSRSSDSEKAFDSDWEDDDEAGIRRYHFDFEARTGIPLPAEFSHESLPKRMWHSFLELRTAARQRRAARLLNMPSESWMYKTHACLLTSCCDATDLGILLAAIWLALWMVIGLGAGMGSSWWLIGIFLFFLRVSARRIFEYWRANRRKQRQRLSSTDIGALGVFRHITSNADSFGEAA
jgi:hypothetical protein